MSLAKDAINKMKSVNEAIDKNKVNESIVNFSTEDFQNRGDKYPASGKPDTIDHDGNYIQFSFKNTSEEVAKNWVAKFLASKNFKYKSLSSQQTGDYNDDWVDVNVTIS